MYKNSKNKEYKHNKKHFQNPLLGYVIVDLFYVFKTRLRLLLYTYSHLIFYPAYRKRSNTVLYAGVKIRWYIA